MPEPTAEAQVLLDDSILTVAEQIALLDLLDAFEPTPEQLERALQPVLVEVAWAEEELDRPDLVDEMIRVELDGEDSLVLLDDLDTPLSPEVRTVLEGPTDEAWLAIEGFAETPLLDAGIYLSALDDLVARDGRPPGPGEVRQIDGELLALAVAEQYELLEEDEAPSGSTDGAGNGGTGSEVVVGLVAVVVLALGVGLVIGLRRRHPGAAAEYDELLEASLTDPLTGIGNRRRLERELAEVLARSGGSASVVMVDLDHFKEVNDRHGHPAGDALRRSVAGELRSLMRPGDRVYRYGGEEFTVVLESTDAAGAVLVAERIRSQLATTSFDVGTGDRLAVTASLGVAAAVDGEDRDGEALIDRADRALYDAKRQGRNRVVCDRSSAGDAGAARS